MTKKINKKYKKNNRRPEPKQNPIDLYEPQCLSWIPVLVIKNVLNHKKNKRGH